MLDYAALVILIFASITVFYGVIIIHDIPYEIAKHRNHPHQDAINTAGWISILTLHVIWPFLWIWATLYREDRGWGFAGQQPQATTDANLAEQLSELKRRLDALEHRPADRRPAETTRVSTNETILTASSAQRIPTPEQGD